MAPSKGKARRRKNDAKELPPKRGRGRPRVEIDWTKFDKLCEIHCTLQEISDILGHDLKTIENACERDHGITFRELFRKKSAFGKGSLRHSQFQQAIGRDAVIDHRGNVIQLPLRPNADMSKWLGKNWLKQSENGMPDESEELSPFDDDDE